VISRSKTGHSANQAEVVCIANLLKVLIIFYTAVEFWKGREQPLSTVGDAIASFLQRSDDTTLSMCLATKDQLPKSQREVGKASPQRWSLKTVRLWKAATGFRWAWTLVP
jgi:hypothetical protein